MTSRRSPEILDEGLQVERTHLAWTRTTLCLAAALAAMAKAALSDPAFLGLVAIVGTLACGAASRTRSRACSSASAFIGDTPAPDGRLPALLAGLLALSTLCAGALYLLR